MTKEQLNEYLGDLVDICFNDGSEVMGQLEFVPLYHKKYSFRHPNMYYVGPVGFKLADIKSLRMLKGENDG